MAAYITLIVMKNALYIKNGTAIPLHEIEITASRSGGAGGQHVNKTNTRITLRWNIKDTHAFTEEQKERVLEKLQSRLTTEGDLIIHHSTSRSQEQNKKMALAELIDQIRKALHMPKKRMATRVPKSAKEKRLHTKALRGTLKKTRGRVPQE